MATYERLDYGSPDGSQWGGATSDKVAFYGTVPVSQRAGAAQATSLVGTASSTAVDSNLKGAVIEILNALIAVGIIKGSA